MTEYLPHLLQTIVILGACVVYLARAGVAVAQRKKRGGEVWHTVDSMVEDLHNWHRPLKDQRTNQPYFPWYHDPGRGEELREEVRELRKTIDRMNKILARLAVEIAHLKGEVKGDVSEVKTK